MSIDKAALLAARSGAGSANVEIQGVGQVKVRGLTRAEVLSIQNEDLDAAGMERKLLAFAMVEPALTEDDVAEWQKVAPAGELEPISDAIQKLSGLAVKQVKAEMRRFR